jgi:hypothetical protein
VVAGEAPQRGVAIVDPAQPHRGEVQRGGPALGARVQEIRLVGAQRDAAERSQQRAGLGRGEGEHRRADLGDRALAAHPRERERRLGARREHKRDVGREHARGVVQRADARAVVDEVDVVEDDREAPLVRLEVGGQAVDRGLDGRRGAAQPFQGGRGEVVAQPRERGGDVRPQPRDVVVAAVDRDPRRGQVGRWRARRGWRRSCRIASWASARATRRWPAPARSGSSTSPIHQGEHAERPRAFPGFSIRFPAVQPLSFRMVVEGEPEHAALAGLTVEIGTDPADRVTLTGVVASQTELIEVLGRVLGPSVALVEVEVCRGEAPG